MHFEAMFGEPSESMLMIMTTGVSSRRVCWLRPRGFIDLVLAPL
jgi:hypothetical protein